MVRLIWIRHALTRENAERRFIGHIDPLLSDEGVRQAGKLAETWRHAPVTAIYTSDLRRARETAEAIAACHPAVPLVVTPLLREMSFGEWEGLTYEEMVNRDRDALERFYGDPWHIAPPGGETLCGLRRRLDAFLREVAESCGGGTVLAVTHGGIIRLFAALYLAGDPERVWDAPPAHGEALSCRYDGKRGSWAHAVDE